MPALDPTVVVPFLDRIKDSLKEGPDTSTPGPGNINAAPLNYLRAQDMATVLDLLQDALDTGTLAATGGTARSVQDTAIFVADQQLGNVVVFDGNVTAALAGIEARIVSNTTTELFFADGVLPDTPANLDTYVIRGGLVDGAIDSLREGRNPASAGVINEELQILDTAAGLADAPTGSVYGDSRIVTDALVRMFAQLSGNTSPFNLAFELERRISPDSFYGVAFASCARREFDQVRELDPTEPNFGQLLSCTELGGFDLIRLKQAPGVGGTITDFRPDQFKGYKMHIAGVGGDEDVRRILRNTEDSLIINKPYTVEPTEDLPVQITVPLAGAESVRNVAGSAVTHPGSQPGENAYLAEIIERVQTEVVAYTTPT